MLFVVILGTAAVVGLSYWWSRRSRPQRTGPGPDSSMPYSDDTPSSDHHHSPGCGHGHDSGSDAGGGDSGGGDGGGGSD
jgi:hypothetical protein